MKKRFLYTAHYWCSEGPVWCWSVFMEVSRLSTSERQHSQERRVFAGCSKKNCLVCTVHLAVLVFGKF